MAQSRILHQDFERAEQFAGEDSQAVLRSACLRDQRLVAELERWGDDRARALGVLRLSPAIFERAEAQLDIDAMLANRQMWSGFQVMSDAVPAWSDDRRGEFERLAREVYQMGAGAPRRLRLEIDERTRCGPDGLLLQSLRQVTIFHEGETNREPVFGTDDHVTVQARCPALMAVLVFDPIPRIMQVASRGGRRVQEALAQGFVLSFWPAAPEIEKLKPASFALQRLKTPTMFDFERSAGVRSVTLVGLVLRAQAEDRLDCTLRLPGPRSLANLREVARAQFGTGNPLPDPGMRIASADIRFQFEPAGDERKPITRAVKLSLQNGSNTGRPCERHRRIVDVHLGKWGPRPSDSPLEAMAA